MPDFKQSLDGTDLGRLRIVAELWGIEFKALNFEQAISQLTASIMDYELIEEVIESLPGRSKEALSEMMKEHGKMPWSLFTRRFGEVRDMGPGRRDRERPYSSENASPAEALWYRALVGRAFFDSPDGPLEYAYIPDDIFLVIPLPADEELKPLGRPASSMERKNPYLANSRILDDACTLLAALRCGMELDDVNDHLILGKYGPFSLKAEVLFQLLDETGILDPDGLPIPEQVQRFLKADRGEALLRLINTWQSSDEFNELQYTPGLTFEGEWENNPKRTREAILDFLTSIALHPDVDSLEEEFRERSPELASNYWSLSAFISDIHHRQPDFLRPAGDYDTWFIKDEASGKNLRGFNHWDDVEGRLLNFYLGGIMFWLGIIDISLSERPAEQQAIKNQQTYNYARLTAFRYSAWGNMLLNGFAPQLEIQKVSKITVQSDGRIMVPLSAKRALRYQLARFGFWRGFKDNQYYYQLTPDSLSAAQSQGLRIAHLESLLRRNSIVIPPKLLQALKRWETMGVEARIEKNIVLRVDDPVLLAALKSSQASRYLGDALGSKAIVIKKAGIDNIFSTLAKLGYLVEDLLEK